MTVPEKHHVDSLAATSGLPGNPPTLTRLRSLAESLGAASGELHQLAAQVTEALDHLEATLDTIARLVSANLAPEQAREASAAYSLAVASKLALAGGGR